MRTRGYRPPISVHRRCDYCGQLVPRMDTWPMFAEREVHDGLEVIHGRFCAGCRAHLVDMGYSIGSA